MPPKAKAGVVAQLSGTTSNESPNLGGRPKKQKVAFEEAAKDIALGKVQTITSLLGKRNVRPADDLGGSSSSPASAAPLSTSAVTAAPALRPAVRPFANSDELGQAVHSMFGYPPDHPPDAEVPEEYVKECKATLGSNLDFVRRALCTNEDFFFGPQKELILKLANELAAAAAAPNEPNGVAAAPAIPAAITTASTTAAAQPSPQRTSPQRTSPRRARAAAAATAEGGATAGAAAASTSAAAASASSDADDPSDGDSVAPDDSGPADPGLKAVLQGQKKKRFKAPSVAKGHGWKPVWLDTYDWLRSHPNKTRQEWDDTPDEAPEYLYCICCVTHPNVGHKDVLFRKVPQSIRSDKCANHMWDSCPTRIRQGVVNSQHERAYQRWKATCLTGHAETASSTPRPDPENVEDKPLSNLVRYAF